MLEVFIYVVIDLNSWGEVFRIVGVNFVAIFLEGRCLNPGCLILGWNYLIFPNLLSSVLEALVRIAPAFSHMLFLYFCFLSH